MAKNSSYNTAQGSVEESRYYLILAKDLEYGDVSELSRVLEEVSKILEAYSQAILDSAPDFCLPQAVTKKCEV